ncbi:MAG: ATP-binding protein [Anaerolineales bacterium]|nr:ATP-binding protein [Anaerolineales bacterium]
MFVLELKFILALGLLLALAAALLALSLERRLRLRRSPLARLTADEKDLRRQAEYAPLGLVLLDEDCQCLYCNAIARQILSLSPGPLPQTPWREALDEDLALARRSDAGQAPYRIVTLPTGPTISWWIYPLGCLDLVVISDLTHQRRLEATTQTFLNELSHELRTPLTAILAHLELLRMADIPEAARQQSLNTVHTETVRIVRLVQDLLSLSRLELTTALQRKPVNLVMIAEAALTELLPAFDAKQLDLSLQTDTSLPPVLGDAERLKQVFLNILDNAAKFCRTGDKVTVALRRHADGVQVIISDTGPGIPAEHLPHVTRRLYQADPNSPGSGLGLALVDEILRRHHSTLIIRSETAEGRSGTELEFVLPGA